MIFRLLIAGKLIRPTLALLLAVMMSLTALGSALAANCQQQMQHHAAADTSDHAQHASSSDQTVSEATKDDVVHHGEQSKDTAADYASLCHLGFAGCAGCTFPVQSLVQPLGVSAIRFHLTQIDGHSIDWDAHLRPPIGLL